MTTLSIPELIMKKRDAEELTKPELEKFVKSVSNGAANTAQAGAMLMAMYLRGLSTQETTLLTLAMMKSGDILTWPDRWRHLVVDKHSTGGVGEKTSIALAPALAACGVKVPMISGRGLGYTGGTLDKLESIRGFEIMRSQQQIVQQLDTVGCCIVGQTERLVPADKVLYATRDTTGTVDNKSLITASIMSKKAAESLNALVLQVTVGSASMFKTVEQARTVARMMIDSGNSLGIKCTAMLMRMDDPLGLRIGNSQEIIECLECLEGRGPTDLSDTICKMGGQLLVDSGQCSCLVEGEGRIRTSLEDGSAKQKFIDMAVAQGVVEQDAQNLFRPELRGEVLPVAKHVTEFKANKTGYVSRIDALCCGRVVHSLGAGREVPGEQINHAVGLQLLTQLGAKIQEGDVWAKVYHDTSLTETHMALLGNTLNVTDAPPSTEDCKRIFEIMT